MVWLWHAVEESKVPVEVGSHLLKLVGIFASHHVPQLVKVHRLSGFRGYPLLAIESVGRAKLHREDLVIVKVAVLGLCGVSVGHLVGEN